MPSHSAPVGFLPHDQLPMLVDQLMQQGYQCFGPGVENGAIVPRGLQAVQSPGHYQLTQDPAQRYFAWANGPQAIKPLAFAPTESLWRVARDATGTLHQFGRSGCTGCAPDAAAASPGARWAST